MEDVTESDTTIAWLWVIEAMASFKEVSLSLIRDLVQAAPELPCGLAKNAKERIALRCLKDLCARQSRRTSNNNPSSEGSKVEFEISESCENVLQRIVQQTPESDLKEGGPELAKYDILSFVRHKEACLPKLALEKLRDSILDGTHPYADFLREKSGLGSTSQENGACKEGEDRNSVISRPNLTRSDVERERVEASSVPPIIENKDKHLEGNLQTGDVLPSKRGRSDSDPCDEYKTGELENYDGIDVRNVNGKKAKLHASSDNQSLEQNPLPVCEKEPEEGSSERNVSAMTSGHGLAGSDMGAAEEGRVLDGGSDDGMVSKRSHDSDKNEIHEDGPESPRNAAAMPQEAATNEAHACLSPDGSKGVDENHAEPTGIPSKETEDKSSAEEPKRSNKHNLQFPEANSGARGGLKEKTVASEDNKNTECREAEVSSDSDGYHDERSNVAKKKHEFLSSQLVDSHDSLVVDSSEKNLCMKCNEAGQALVCNSTNCQVVVHVKCLGSPVIFDDKVNFYCPFCAYSLAIAEYLEAKKRSSLSRKELSAFIRKGSDEHKPAKSSARLNKKTKHRASLNKDENLLGKTHKDVQMEERAEDEENDFENQNVTVNNPETESPALCNKNGDLECEKGDKVVQECPSEGPQNEVPRNNENLSGAKTDTNTENKTTEDLGAQPQTVKQKDVNASKQLAQEFSLDSSEGDEDDIASNIANYCISVRGRETRYKTYPAIPQSRRKPLPWTAEEEQKIKEGMEIFSDQRKIPWKKILEFGGPVFLECRTTGDLKDKWRNMCRSPKPKRRV